MMSHQEHKRLGKYQNIFETAPSQPQPDSSLSSIIINPYSSSSSSLNFHPSPTTLNYTCFNHKPLRFTRIPSPPHFPQHHHHPKLTGAGCLNVSPRPAWHRLKLCFRSFSLMAAHDDLSVHLPTEFRKKKFIGQQRREELEREVTVLHKMLAHEQKVHEYLDRLQHRQNGSALTIPNFLPPKMKEILAELAMVENEITRLESQIKQLRSDVKHEKEVNIETKYKEWGRGALKNHRESSPLPPNPNNVGKRTNDKVTFETKALHFISKAIKGDYHLSDFSMNEKTMSSKGFASQKENAFSEEGPTFHEKVSKRSGIIKAPSPLREPRHPTPRRDRYLDIPNDIPSRILSTPLHTEDENVHRWPPNKLSENIMKCLIFIFVRLLRTSRVMELEKSGPIARSTNFSLSFRAETGSSSKTSLMFQKDSRQQDPYGIFDSEESIPRDIGPYKNLVRFTSSSMDLKCIQNSSSVPLFQKLKVLIDGLKKVDLRFLSHQQKLAFWINMYNACIMHGYLQYGVPSVFSPENLLALINKATLNIAGNTINAQAIEHFILRKPDDSLVKEILGKGENDSKEIIVRELYGLETPDPNITFALCCGTRSSPAVKIYTAEGVTAELERSKLEYLQAAIIVNSSKRIALPELLLRNMKDFAADRETLMEWVCQQLPTSGSLRKSIVDCFRGSGHGGKASAVVEKIPYEFEFQYLLPI
ncbi:UNVERIFIED_CONTAM: hypothetical protein Sradi_0348800 [Sesamum radiatum]|uniref:DUF547 domain-containing protein/Lzipper-MIP1 domain-containing protein n=1 Tax=Sesamum radiatum TaxID=300843 RepID=A0AAW2W582_SESRA